MTNTNESTRFDRSAEQSGHGEERVPYVSLLPEDFAERLERFREAADLSWSGLAKAIGVDYKQMYRWKEGGTEPCGGAIHSLYLFASRIPNGLKILMGEEFQMTFLKDPQECPFCRRRNSGEERPDPAPTR